MLRYAAVDIGSNSTRMLTAEVSPIGLPGAPPRVLAEERVVTRLGESVFRDARQIARGIKQSGQVKCPEVAHAAT